MQLYILKKLVLLASFSQGLELRMRLCMSRSALTSSSSSSPPPPETDPIRALLPQLFLARLRVGRCFSLAVDLDQSMGIMLPKFPVMVHHTWHSFMISSWERTWKAKQI